MVLNLCQKISKLRQVNCFFLLLWLYFPVKKTFASETTSDFKYALCTLCVFRY